MSVHWGKAEFAGTRHQYAKAEKQGVGRFNNLLRESPMQKPPLDPDVADTAPSDSVLTSTTRSTSSRICACWTRMRLVLIGAKSHE
jgi:hypothetical protein